MKIFHSACHRLCHRRVRRLLAGILLPGWILLGTAAVADDPAVVGLGYGPLGYDLPAVGSYHLSDLGPAPDGQVVTSTDETTSLHALFDGHVSLLSFMYSSCIDANGCPLSAHVLHKIKSQMQEDAELADRLKLFSMSFDPDYDTPEKMKLYESGYQLSGSEGDWSFITTRSSEQLAPILSAYRQDIVRLTALTPTGANEISHLLRVYLVDAKNNIRNIYSVSFLHADILINDVRTLLAEQSQQPEQPVSDTAPDSAVPVVTVAKSDLSRPGDSKSGYESADYQTDSLSLESRVGSSSDLLATVLNPPLGLPATPIPESNPITRASISLGRKLFYDRRLSINDTFSCASCHIPEQGFTSNELATAVGVEGRTVRRNSLSIYNVAHAPRLFYDGREDTLEQQVWNPFLARNEMANPSIGYVLRKLRSFEDYDGLFEAAFNGRGAGMETVGMAIASYERTLLSGNSPFDRWFFDQQESAISEQAKEGFRLFNGKAACVACHSLGQSSALFSDYQLHNTGLGFLNSFGNTLPKQRVQIAPGLTVDVDSSLIEVISEKPPADLGLYEITEDPADRWKYRTPSLRNVALTAPYMHSGQFQTLNEVMEFYNAGGVPHAELDPLMRPLDLSPEEIAAVIAFLVSLTGSNTDELVSDAFAAPIGDPGVGSN